MTNSALYHCMTYMPYDMAIFIVVKKLRAVNRMLVRFMCSERNVSSLVCTIEIILASLFPC